MATRQELDGPPAAFVRAVEQLRSASIRPEVVCEPMPAPQRIAPHAYAMTGDVLVAGDELGTGRIVLLHDPAGNDAWEGTFRLVTFARADVDLEMVIDPLLPEVGWSWLTDALEARDAHYVAPSGSVTTVRSEAFGSLREDGGSAQVEVRASWTPVASVGDDLGSEMLLSIDRHVSAWADLLCEVAGIPPLAPGVLPLPSRRGGTTRGRRR